jgi:hypothetical protein
MHDPEKIDGVYCGHLLEVIENVLDAFIVKVPGV